MTSGAVAGAWNQDELNTLMDWDAPRVRGTLTTICDYLAGRPGS